MSVEEDLCAVPDCPFPVDYGVLCNYHHRQHLRGIIDAGGKSLRAKAGTGRKPILMPCKIDGCNHVSCRNGLCKIHCEMTYRRENKDKIKAYQKKYYKTVTKPKRQSESSRKRARKEGNVHASGKTRS